MIENFDFGRLTVIGDILLDQYIVGTVNRISPEAPVPVLLRSKHSVVPGGAANVAVNAASLGCTVNLVGVVGPDANADILRTILGKHKGINVSGLVEEPEWSTISKTRVLSGQQQIVRIDEEEVTGFTEQTRQRLISNAQVAIDNSDVLVCSDYAKGVLADDVLEAIIRYARGKNIPVIVDPKRKDFTAYSGATLVTPNRTEAALATNLPVNTDEEVLKVAATLSEQFGGDVLLTRSEKGMTLWQRNGHIHHEAAHQSEVYDVSGAGDTVLATVASMLSAGQDLDTAVMVATVAASIVVRKLGTAAISREELSQQLLKDVPEAGLLASWESAARTVENWRKHGASVVFTNGCFDLLHPGHIALIKGAAAEGDKLIVAINSDASVKRLKGEARPVQNEIARSTVIGALRDVDMVVIFDEDTPLDIIRALKPNVVVKGADYTEDAVVGGDFVKEHGGRVALVDIVNGHSTTSIVKKISN
ncbi:D-glycero-beta-D-manno-heptose-7-phosphate kinase [Gluconobacter cerinus]|uniref:D-glycero-beta-D-manno-heptose-7-phosphate kinase n=1 Tax=Gluconobacter cerinus TaxID=38307 RepID=UPI001B8D2073|nr:D-glycero-beta-D-manno-heptose-7-phosphate kinase [Gluconobacter cerinus]MBS1023565.1 D-glycero-beta-D-manno-heptose-7-phosphate kinase [Gluconobacter cerinus]MBS1044946.1 D-glycero-beta-D-manno-heptose-7-phosphate kinase [Gluconobacter cerinus]